MAISAIGATDSTFLLVGGLLCLVLLSIAAVRWSTVRGVTARDLTREELARLREQEEVRRSMEELLTQLEELSGRINAQVDAHVARVEAVLKTADARIEQLKGLLRPAKSDDGFKPGLPVAEAAEVGEERTAPSQVQPPPMDPPAPSVPPPLPERIGRIYALADAGSTPLAIAGALRMSVGEVELVLSLRTYK